MVSDPTTMPLGPITKLCPFGSVTVWKPSPGVKVLPPMTTSGKEVDCGEGEVTTPPGSSVNVNPSEVRVLAAVT